MYIYTYIYIYIYTHIYICTYIHMYTFQRMLFIGFSYNKISEREVGVIMGVNMYIYNHMSIHIYMNLIFSGLLGTKIWSDSRNKKGRMKSTRRRSGRVESKHFTASTATHCNTLQYTATHCNTLQHIVNRNVLMPQRCSVLKCVELNRIDSSVE